MFHVEWRPCEPQWIQILWLKIRCGEKWNTNRRNWGWQRAENIGALMWKYMFFMWIDLDVKFVSINSLFKRPHDKSFCFIPVPSLNDQNCSLQFHLWHDYAWPDNDCGHMLTSLKIPPASSIGAAVLLLLPLLVILGHVQQVDVSTNQPETAMTLLM